MKNKDITITSIVTMPEIKSDECIMQEIFTLRTKHIVEYYDNPEYLYMGRTQYRDLRVAVQQCHTYPAEAATRELYDGMEVVQVLNDDFLKVGK